MEKGQSNKKTARRRRRLPVASRLWFDKSVCTQLPHSPIVISSNQNVVFFQEKKKSSNYESFIIILK